MHAVWELPLKPEGIVVELPEGRHVRIRPARKSDKAALEAGYERLSPESRYFRFFSNRSKLGDPLVKSLTDIDHKNHFAWGVFDPDRPSEVGDDSGLAVASARLIRDDDPTSAEAALAVVDEYQGRGIGRFLIELLVATAADVGAKTLRFEILRENRAMLRLISGMGGTSTPIEGDRTVVEYQLPVPEPDLLDVPAGALYHLLRHVAAEAGLNGDGVGVAGDGVDGAAEATDEDAGSIE